MTSDAAADMLPMPPMEAMVGMLGPGVTAASVAMMTAVGIVAVFNWWCLLRLFNKSARVTFKSQVMPKLMENPVALALFFCGLFGSTSYLLASVYSNFMV